MASRNAGRPAVGHNAQGLPQLRTTQPRTRFSFAAATPIQLQRSQFHPSSPTNSDIDSDTMSTLSPQLAPISRSISVIAEQHMRAQEGQDQQGPTGHNQIPNPFPIPEQYTSQHQPQQPQVQSQGIETDKKDPYYMQPPSEPHPSETNPLEERKLEPVASPHEQRLGPTNTLFPAYKLPASTTLYSPQSLSGATDVFPPSHITTRPEPQEPDHSWQTSLCANSACIFALLCPCIVYGKTQHRLSQKSAGKPATDLLGYSVTNGSCLLMAVACCFSGAFALVQRSRVRKAYGIEGGCGDDCIKSFCCCCCVLAQDESEMVKREEERNRTVQTSYVSPVGMAYPPPPRR